MNAITKTAQIRLTRSSPACWRITFDNPPLNLMGPEFVLEFREIMTELSPTNRSGSSSSTALSKDFSSTIAIFLRGSRI